MDLKLLFNSAALVQIKVKVLDLLNTGQMFISFFIIFKDLILLLLKVGG